MTFTAPQIILNLGYTAAEAQLLTIPIYIGALISLIVCAILADRFKTRWKFVVFPYLVALAGFVGLLAVPQERLPGLTYFFLFPVTMGCKSIQQHPQAHRVGARPLRPFRCPSYGLTMVSIKKVIQESSPSLRGSPTTSHPALSVPAVWPCL